MIQREVKFYAFSLHFKLEILSIRYFPFDIGHGFSQFWASVYYMDNGNDSNSGLVYRMGTRKGWRNVEVLYEQREQHKFKLLLAHGREPPNLEDEKLKSRDQKQFLPKVTQKSPASWLLGPFLFPGPVSL